LAAMLRFSARVELLVDEHDAARHGLGDAAEADGSAVEADLALVGGG